MFLQNNIRFEDQNTAVKANEIIAVRNGLEHVRSPSQLINTFTILKYNEINL